MLRKFFSVLLIGLLSATTFANWVSAQNPEDFYIEKIENQYETRAAHITLAKKALQEAAKVLKNPQNLWKMSDDLIEHSNKIANQMIKTARSIRDNTGDALGHIWNSINNVVKDTHKTRQLYSEFLNTFKDQLTQLFRNPFN